MTLFTRCVSTLVFLLTFISFSAGSSPAHAYPWLVQVDKRTSLYTIDLGTSPPTAYGPFLYGQLGPIGSIVSSFAAAPGRSYGLVTEWDDNKIFRVDFRDPTNPVVTAEIATDKKVLDIAFGPDPSWAVCTGGASSTFLTFVNPTTNTSAFYTVLGGASQSVAVTPDGRTIIVGDNVNKQIIYGPVNSDHTGLTSETVLTGLAGGCAPINISVSPDGRTVLVPCGNIKQINVFRVDDGTLVETTPVADLGGRAQSVAFTPDGSRAFFARTDPATPLDPMSWLKVNGPGDVVLGGDAVADGCADSPTSFNYGVNSIAVSPDGAFVANSLPSTNVSSTTIPIIDAASFSEVLVSLTTDKPYGMDFLTPYRLTAASDGTGTGTVTDSTGDVNCGADCKGYFWYGDTVTLEAVADAGSVFWGWSGGGCSGLGACQTTMDAAKTVTASFMTDQDKDGSPDLIENAAPNGGDGDQNGVLDALESNVASFKTYAGDRYLTLASDEGTELSGVKAIATPAPESAPKSVLFPVGFFEFTLRPVTAGGPTIVTLYLDGQDIIDTYYKYGPTPENPTSHWYEFWYDGRTGAVVDMSGEQTVIRLYFRDGERGDHDLTANGVIADGGGPGRLQGSGGSEGGCFINTQFP